MTDEITLSVIIVNHRSEAVLGDCLAALAASDYPCPFEILLVDNPAGSEALACPPGLKIRRLAVPGRLGFGAACNLGAASAAGRLLLFLNPDVRVEPAALARLEEALIRSEGFGAVTGRLTGRDGRFQPSCRQFPTRCNLFFSRGSIVQRMLNLGGGRYTLPDYPEPTPVAAAAATMLMIPRELFQRLGGFDPAFFLYLEDSELCYRLRQSGYGVLYVPSAGAVHLWGHATRAYRFRRLIWHHQSVWRFFVKHHPSLLNYLWTGPALTANCLLSLAGELCTFRRDLD